MSNKNRLQKLVAFFLFAGSLATLEAKAQLSSSGAAGDPVYYYKPTPLTGDIDRRIFADPVNGEPTRDQINWMIWGQGRNAANTKINGWNLGTFTGAKVPDPVEAYQRGAANTGYGGMSVEMHNDPQLGPVFGTIINTFGQPWKPGEINISAGILEYDFSDSVANIYPFSKPDNIVHFAFKLQVPQAYVEGQSRSHLSPSITFDDKSTGQYFWYAPFAFNLGPGAWPSEGISWDKATNSAIVGSQYGANTKYISTEPGSSYSTAKTWTGWKPFGYSVSGAQLLLAIDDVNRYKQKVQTDCIAAFQASRGSYPTPTEIEQNCPNKDFSRNLANYKIGSFLMDAEVARPNSAKDNGNLGYSVTDIRFYMTPGTATNPVPPLPIPAPTPVPAPNPNVTSIFREGGFDNPRFRFGNGQSINTRMDFFPGLPEISGYGQSPWYVAQWKKTQYLRPDVMLRAPAGASDPVYKTPLFAFPTPNNESHIYAFQEPQTKKMVYELYGEHGWLDKMGGSNVFLQTDAVKPAEATLEKPIMLQMRAKISQQITSYNSQEAKTDGSVVSQFFSGFTLHYQDPKSAKTIDLFLQIYQGGSDPKIADVKYRGCYYGGNVLQLVSGANLSDPFFKTASPTGPLESAEYNLNKYLCDMISKPITCIEGDKTWDYVFPAETQNLKNWNVNSYYVGIETQDRLDLSTNAPRGAIALGVQLSDIKLLKYNDKPDVSCQDLNPPPPAPAPPVPAPTDPESSGKFCSGKNEILWRCGLSQPPAPKWTDVGGGCYHFNNGPSPSCKKK